MRRPAAFRPPAMQTAAEYDRSRRELTETRRLYSLARWRRIRDEQLEREPLCRFCLEADPPLVVEARVCDHVEPHRGDVDAFWRGPFQSLCKTCHDSEKQRREG